MGWLEFLSSMVASLAWPLAVFAVALLFRSQIGDLINRLRQFSAGGVSAQLDAAEKKGEAVRAQQADASVDIDLDDTSTAATQTINPPNETSPSSDRYLKLVEISPALAVLDLWSSVERLVVEIATRHDYNQTILRSIGRTIERLAADGAIDQPSYALLRDLRAVRNAAAHNQEVTPSDAGRFKELADLLTVILRLKLISSGDLDPS